jgi:hypothetical protein
MKLAEMDLKIKNLKHKKKKKSDKNLSKNLSKRGMTHLKTTKRWLCKKGRLIAIQMRPMFHLDAVQA